MSDVQLAFRLISKDTPKFDPIDIPLIDKHRCLTPLSQCVIFADIILDLGIFFREAHTRSLQRNNEFADF